jgi:hypothetical protein
MWRASRWTQARPSRSNSSSIHLQKTTIDPEGKLETAVDQALAIVIAFLVGYLYAASRNWVWCLVGAEACNGREEALSLISTLRSSSGRHREGEFRAYNAHKPGHIPDCAGTRHRDISLGLARPGAGRSTPHAESSNQTANHQQCGWAYSLPIGTECSAQPGGPSRNNLRT